VNCICPGWIQTARHKALWENEHTRDRILERVLAQRPGRPADLVGLAIYLSAGASDFTTGRTFYVDGGFLAGG